MKGKGIHNTTRDLLIREGPDELFPSLLRRCFLCARRCGTDRTRGDVGPCGAGLLPKVACHLPHKGEEPLLSGENGSGAIFFSGCSLRCIFCQNIAISQHGQGTEVSMENLSAMMLQLQEKGCHNINLVSPTHYAPQIAVALDAARKQGLCLPVVYNSHGLDSKEALHCMKGRVDIYLPDMKYANNRIARDLSGIQGYREANRAALQSMFSQTGHLQEDRKTRTAIRGLHVRILLLPCHLEGAKASLVYLKQRFSTALSISLMAQYAPLHKACERSPLNRTLGENEYEEVVDFAFSLGFRNLWLQDPKAAYRGIPDFSSQNPFVF